MKYLLDSNILIALGLDTSRPLAKRVADCDEGDLVTSVIAYAEVLHGSVRGKPPSFVGLEALKRPCVVTLWSDSQYLIHAMTKGWLDGWQKKGWRTSGKEPVKNRDLWERLLRALGEHTIEWRWVRGHTGDVENERCDQLAVAAANGPDLLVDDGFDG